MGGASIGVDLATPTAAPPPWLTTRYPDVLPVDERGSRHSHGSRQHFCVCNPTYRRLAGRIVQRLTDELGDHPAIRMWHVHNEYACHVPYCYLDVVSTDNYPDPANPDSPALSAMHYDLIRSVNKTVPWIVMEQTTARVNWRERNVPKVPGQMRGLSYQAVARGASGVLFFQWRASRAGAEKFHSAMVSHSGQASPIWREVTTLGQEFDRAEPLDDAVVSARAGMVFSWPNWWAVESPAGPAHDFSIQDHLAWMYLPLYRRCVTLDFCHPQEALESYEALVVPSLYLVTEAEASNLVEYVERGGTVVMSYWSGIVDEHDQVYLGPYGGPLRPLMGCDVLEVAPLPSGDVVDVEWADGGRTTASYWLDLAVPSDGEVLATVVSGPWAGTPAVVRARCGAGSAYYIGTRLDADGLQPVYDMIPALRGERAGGGEDQVDGVERVTRRSPGRDYEFLVNHSDGERKVQLDAPGYDLLGDRPVDGTLELEQRGVAIVRRDTAPPDGA